MKNYKKFVADKSRNENLSDERVRFMVGSIKKENHDFISREAAKMGISMRAYVDLIFDQIRDDSKAS